MRDPRALEEDRLRSVENRQERFMTERQVFGAVVRGVGVYLAVDGVVQLLMEIFRITLDSEKAFYRFSTMHDFLYGGILAVAGSLLVRKPDWIVEFAYGRGSASSQTPDWDRPEDR
jgi:hypothetical protein